MEVWTAFLLGKYEFKVKLLSHFNGVLLRDLSPEQKYELIHMKEKTDVDRIKAFFRKNYPVHAKEWSENAWKKCHAVWEKA